MDTRFEPKYKIVVFGLKGVGKTTLVNQVGRILPADNLTKKEYSISSFSQGGPFPAEITLVDQPTYETPHYQTLAQDVFKDVDAGVLIFSLTDKESFEKIPGALMELKGYIHNGPIILVGNKADLVKDQQVNSHEVYAFAETNKLTYKEISAKHQVDVANIFQAIIEESLCANLTKDITSSMSEVGKSRVSMRNALLETCKVSKSLPENLKALEKCGNDAQEHHEKHSGLRWPLVGTLFFPVCNTKKISEGLIEKYNQRMDCSPLSSSNR